MKLGLYCGKQIKITDIDGRVFEGKGGYSSEDDNPEGVASIRIGDYELYEDEIAHIEIVSADISVATFSDSEEARRIV